jgi:SAM-dependent methyltransferase
MYIKKFDKYNDYLSLQKEKTMDPIRREKWIKNINKNAEIFKETFIPYNKIFCYDDINFGICLGARTGEEVLSLRMLGLQNCIGIDLVPHADLVIEADLHNLPYEDEEVDFVYTNVFDHILKVKSFFKEMERVLAPGGKLFIQLQIGSELDKYGVLHIGSEGYNFFENYVQGSYLFKKILEERPKVKTPHNYALNWNVILEKI